MMNSLRRWLWRMYFRPRSWETSGRAYEAVGVRRVKELLFGGRYFNALVSAIRGSTYRPFRGAEWLRRWLRFTVVVEAGHVVIGIYMLALVIDALVEGRGRAAARIFAINVLVNVYPVMVQRYNRARLIRIFRMRAPLLLAVLLLAQTACGHEGRAVIEPARLDSAGVSIVMNTGTDRPLDRTFEPVLDLGSTDDGPTAFFRVSNESVGVDAEGNLYVLDAGRHVVSVFAAEGGLVRTYGRQGGGPGEFGFPAYLAVAPTGASAVYDFDRRGLVLFDAAGGHEGFFPLDVPQEGTIAFVGDGTIGAAVAHPTPAADSTDVRLLLLGRDTAALSNVRRVDRFEAQQFRCPIPARPSLFLPRVLWDAAHGRVILSDEAGYSVRAYDDGRLTGIWRRDVPVIEATLDLAAWEVAEGDSLRAFGCTVPADEAATRLGYAEIVPVVRRLTVAPDGGLWILRTTETPGEHVVDVFDPTGAYGGTLPPGSPFPTDFRALDEIVTVERDELDVPHVRIYRIVRPS